MRSIYRFWLLLPIESYLRGATSFADQMFLIARGVIQDTVRNILAMSVSRSKELLQNCFDILAGLVKFNKIGFQLLDTELAEPENVLSHIYIYIFSFFVFVVVVVVDIIDSDMI